MGEITVGASNTTSAEFEATRKVRNPMGPGRHATTRAHKSSHRTRGGSKLTERS